MGFATKALLPWPGTYPQDAEAHLPGEACEQYRRLLAGMPDSRLEDAAGDVGRLEHICVTAGTEVAAGAEVRAYLFSRMHGVACAADVQGVGGRWVGVVGADGPDDVYDAAVVLQELLGGWPAPSARADASVAVKILAAVDVVIPSMRDVRTVHVPVEDGVIAPEGEELVVDFTDGDSDEVDADLLNDVQADLARQRPDLAGVTGELLVYAQDERLVVA